MNIHKPSVDKLKSVIADFKSKYQPTLCGIVIRSNLKYKVLSMIPNIKNETSVIPIGLPLFFDSQQTEDFLIFEDESLLKAYLTRHQYPEKWAMELVKHLPNQKSLDDLYPTHPSLPEIPPIGFTHFYRV